MRESTDLIERLCIEAALELTGDNRASAAEMLGLSRQSLYVKLRRYGLGDLAPEKRQVRTHGSGRGYRLRPSWKGRALHANTSNYAIECKSRLTIGAQRDNVPAWHARP